MPFIGRPAPKPALSQGNSGPRAAARYGSKWRWLLLLALLASGCAVVDPRQSNPPAPGIARSETVTVDGVPERLLIRGNDPAHNPLLLFIHGGPGFPDALFRQVNSDLERDFTVVHWDQRGTGYSYFPDIPPETMRVEQFVRETLLVARHLCREFHQPKLYLVGHSWGTLPAILAAARDPDRFYAYVALSQLVDLDESERRVVRQALQYAEAQGATAKAARLRALGPPPYLDLETQDRAIAIVNSLFPRVEHQATSLRLAMLSLGSRYYSVGQLFRVKRSYDFSRRLLDPQLHGWDVRQLVPTLRVPAYFFVGLQDATFGVSLQREYFRRLDDPRGKRFVLFQNSTHWPHLEEPAVFLREMRAVKARTWRPTPASAARQR